MTAWPQPGDIWWLNRWPSHRDLVVVVVVGRGAMVHYWRLNKHGRRLRGALALGTFIRELTPIFRQGVVVLRRGQRINPPEGA